MPIVIATAEPFGTYHLRPFVGAVEAVHLVPWTYGLEPALDVTDDFGVLSSADLLVVTGWLNPFTAAIAEAARARNVPICFSQVALSRHLAGSGLRLPFERTTVISESGRNAVGAHLGVDPASIEVLGNPMLDRLPEYAPIEDRVLVLTTVSREVDADDVALLMASAHALRHAGYHVIVRPHPREDPTIWDGFVIDRSPTPLTMGATARAAIGYPSTSFSVLAAIGVPTIPVYEPDSPTAIHLETVLALSPERVHRADDAIDAVRRATPPDAAAVEYVTGPLGGATERTVKVWRTVAER